MAEPQHSLPRYHRRAVSAARRSASRGTLHLLEMQLLTVRVSLLSAVSACVVLTLKRIQQASGRVLEVTRPLLPPAGATP